MHCPVCSAPTLTPHQSELQGLVWLQAPLRELRPQRLLPHLPHLGPYPLCSDPLLPRLSNLQLQLDQPAAQTRNTTQTPQCNVWVKKLDPTEGTAGCFLLAELHWEGSIKGRGCHAAATSQGLWAVKINGKPSAPDKLLWWPVSRGNQTNNGGNNGYK
ncbi:UNVERIFIED_CONTAM: hypothetical protein FKN15_016925 [Acipenser sinensis]